MDCWHACFEIAVRIYALKRSLDGETFLFELVRSNETLETIEVLEIELVMLSHRVIVLRRMTISQL